MTNPTLRAQVALQQLLLGRVAGANEGTGRRHRRLLGVGMAVGSLFTPAAAMAAPQPATGGGAGSGCDAGRATGLQKIVKDAATFLIVLGGTVAVLMFTIGGFMIMAGGGSRKHVQKGMGIVKNAFIGLAVMVSGLFVRNVLTSFIGGASSGDASTNCITQDTLQ